MTETLDIIGRLALACFLFVGLIWTLAEMGLASMGVTSPFARRIGRNHTPVAERIPERDLREGDRPRDYPPLCFDLGGGRYIGGPPPENGRR